MAIDARRIPTGETIETEVCIIGAGPAGIALARELAGQDFRVCLLETGGFEPDADIQSLAADAGDPTGDPYSGAIYMRTRQYGGTANQWQIDMGDQRYGVRYVPLDAIDFEKRDWLPHSGWCFDKAHLDPFYQRAQAVCQAGPYDYRPEAWEDEQAQQLPFQGDRVRTQMYQFGPRDAFLQDYRQQLEQSHNVTLYVYATVTELETDELSNTVTRARIATLQGNQFWIAAKHFVLAVGGLEAARLLLLSDRVQKTGLGNQNDLVGRFLMDHPVVRAGILSPSNQQVFSKMALYDARHVNGTMVLAKPTLTDDLMRREQLLNINAAMFPLPSFRQLNLLRMLFPQGKRYRSTAVASAQALLASARRKEIPKDLVGHLANLLMGIDDLIYFEWRKKSRIPGGYGFDNGGWSTLPDREQRFGCFEVIHVTEQAPDPDNRVTLGSEVDQLGCRKVQLHWRWNEIDRRSAKRAIQIFTEELAQAGVGRLRVELDRGMPQMFLPSIHHHMGTTRMHDNPKQGVVDANCQVHGVSNLFIASSSVFPTGGYANPTLTIVAIAIRVADHLKTLV